MKTILVDDELWTMEQFREFRSELIQGLLLQGLFQMSVEQAAVE